MNKFFDKNKAIILTLLSVAGLLLLSSFATKRKDEPDTIADAGTGRVGSVPVTALADAKVTPSATASTLSKLLTSVSSVKKKTAVAKKKKTVPAISKTTFPTFSDLFTSIGILKPGNVNSKPVANPTFTPITYIN